MIIEEVVASYQQDYKAMATPMALNLKLLSNASLESVDAMMYRQMIGQAMPSIGRALQDVASVWDQV